MLDSVRRQPCHEKHIQSWFNQQIDWDFVYEAPHTITRNAYTLQVQFKITHNILPTQEKLYNWKIENSPHCLCGIVDTNLHHIVLCKQIRPFWQKIFDFMKTTLKGSFPITDFELFFGIKNELNDLMIDYINFILLTAKVFIWKEKRWGRPCTMHDFLPFLREQLLIENSTCMFKKKPFCIELLEII